MPFKFSAFLWKLISPVRYRSAIPKTSRLPNCQHWDNHARWVFVWMDWMGWQITVALNVIHGHPDSVTNAGRDIYQQRRHFGDFNFTPLGDSAIMLYERP